MTWECRRPSVVQYEPRPLLGGGDEEDFDVSGFTSPRWIIHCEIRPTLSLLGHRLWTGRWRTMRMVAP